VTAALCSEPAEREAVNRMTEQETRYDDANLLSERKFKGQAFDPRRRTDGPSNKHFTGPTGRSVNSDEEFSGTTQMTLSDDVAGRGHWRLFRTRLHSAPIWPSPRSYRLVLTSDVLILNLYLPLSILSTSLLNHALLNGRRRVSTTWFNCDRYTAVYLIQLYNCYLPTQFSKIYI